MKYLKPTAWIFIALAVFIIGIFAIRFSTNEDSWTCVDGRWAKHGNPETEAPISGCGEQLNKQINFIRYGYISDRETTRPNSGMYLIYEEPGKPALSAKLEFNEESICEFSEEGTPCISLNSTIEKATENKRVLINGVSENEIIKVIKLISGE